MSKTILFGNDVLPERQIVQEKRIQSDIDRFRRAGSPTESRYVAGDPHGLTSVSLK